MRDDITCIKRDLKKTVGISTLICRFLDMIKSATGCHQCQRGPGWMS